jgi:hypothetical protein
VTLEHHHASMRQTTHAPWSRARRKVCVHPTPIIGRGGKQKRESSFFRVHGPAIAWCLALPCMRLGAESSNGGCLQLPATLSMTSTAASMIRCSALLCSAQVDGSKLALLFRAGSLGDNEHDHDRANQRGAIARADEVRVQLLWESCATWRRALT